jgi:IS5 family transposase
LVDHVDNADGVVLDHNVEIGNPADAPQPAPAIRLITYRTAPHRTHAPPAPVQRDSQE